jgi:hypothetical protein
MASVAEVARQIDAVLEACSMLDLRVKIRRIRALGRGRPAASSLTF